MFVCVVSLSQPTSKDLDYLLWDVMYLRGINRKKMKNVRNAKVDIKLTYSHNLHLNTTKKLEITSLMRNKRCLPLKVLYSLTFIFTLPYLITWGGGGGLITRENNVRNMQ